MNSGIIGLREVELMDSVKSVLEKFFLDNPMTDSDFALLLLQKTDLPESPYQRKTILRDIRNWKSGIIPNHYYIRAISEVMRDCGDEKGACCLEGIENVRIRAAGRKKDYLELVPDYNAGLELEALLQLRLIEFMDSIDGKNVLAEYEKYIISLIDAPKYALDFRPCATSEQKPSYEECVEDVRRTLKVRSHPDITSNSLYTAILDYYIYNFKKAEEWCLKLMKADFESMYALWQSGTGPYRMYRNKLTEFSANHLDIRIFDLLMRGMDNFVIENFGEGQCKRVSALKEKPQGVFLDMVVFDELYHVTEFKEKAPAWW
jgi:hypothetical protein